MLSFKEFFRVNTGGTSRTIAPSGQMSGKPLFDKTRKKITKFFKAKDIQRAILRYVDLVTSGSFVDTGHGSINQLSTSAFASKAAREFDVPARMLIKAINSAVKKGVLPKELTAEYDPEGDEDI